MTRDDIIKLAREAGLERNGYWEFDMNRLERFAALIAAAEREACAKVCESRFMGDLTREDIEVRRCAAAIRARGNT